MRRFQQDDAHIFCTLEQVSVPRRRPSCVPPHAVSPPPFADASSPAGGRDRRLPGLRAHGLRRAGLLLPPGAGHPSPRLPGGPRDLGPRRAGGTGTEGGTAMAAVPSIASWLCHRVSSASRPHVSPCQCVPPHLVPALSPCPVHRVPVLPPCPMCDVPALSLCPLHRVPALPPCPSLAIMSPAICPGHRVPALSPCPPCRVPSPLCPQVLAIASWLCPGVPHGMSPAPCPGHGVPALPPHPARHLPVLLSRPLCHVPMRRVPVCHLPALPSCLCAVSVQRVPCVTSPVSPPLCLYVVPKVVSPAHHVPRYVPVSCPLR